MGLNVTWGGLGVIPGHDCKPELSDGCRLVGWVRSNWLLFWRTASGAAGLLVDMHRSDTEKRAPFGCGIGEVDYSVVIRAV